MRGWRFEIGQAIFQELVARDVDGAREEILNFIQTQSTAYGTTIYYHGWDALGTVAVLRSIVQGLQSKKDPRPELSFGRVIYIDCSTWISKRVMQRKIAEELKLDPETMVMFDKQDQEDDFNGVNPTSRDAIQYVAQVIDRTLRDSRFLMVFLNGSDEEVDLSRLGVPEFHDRFLIWTFKTRFPTKGLIQSYLWNHIEMLSSKLRYTNIFLYGLWSSKDVLTSSEIGALVREEAGSILTHHPCMRDDDRAMAIDCYLYGLFLHHSFHKGASRLWAAHGANYWICDGIIQGARTREISKALYQEVSFECDDISFDSMKFKREMMLGPDTSYLVFDEDDAPSWINMPHHRWISITSKNKIVGGNMMKGTLARASSIILAFEITSSPQGLPDDLMEQCNNLRVLILSNCAFNFLSPLFAHCNTLRFLGLDHCKNNNTRGLVEREAKWTCLSSLWVLDLRYTNWDEILSKEKMDLMGNIMELNIEGSMCWQYATGQLEGRLPYLQRIRIVKPPCEAEGTSLEIDDNSFLGKTELEVLDLSGNKDMKKLPTSLSQASNLQVLVLDGCAGLENVVLSNSLLRSFSFDGYGSASNWTSMDELPPEASRPDAANKKGDVVKISKISLEGCTQLKNLFLRGLPNLVELDLSGCAIKILDFGTMVVDVPRLKRLFLLGCEHLRAIKWGPPRDDAPSKTRMTVDLELLCIDTRPSVVVPGGCTRPSIAQQQPGLQVHAITADARLARSLYPPIDHAEKVLGKDAYFDIRITSSSIVRDEEKTSEEHCHVVAAGLLYNDVSTKVGDSSLTPFPQPPSSQLNRHMEIGHGSCNVGSEVGPIRRDNTLRDLMEDYVQSLHVHDTGTTIAMPHSSHFNSLKWFRVERCPRLDPVFPPRNSPCDLETIWASDLLMARCIWSKGRPLRYYHREFSSLQHLHLRSCPSLRYALPVWTSSSFPKLETLHIIHCGSLRHVFALDNKEYDINTSEVLFPELTTIHLHDVPALQQICEVKRMIAPKLETIRTRGCWNLRRLPALGLEAASERRRPPAVEMMEKDVWEALEWDGLVTGHHPSLYKAPQHSRYYKSRRLLRGTVLR